MKQGDVLSPTLFLLFVSELALHIKETSLVICLDDTNLGFLLNEDDIILRTECESDLDNMLNVGWSTRLINFGSTALEYFVAYKYLWFILDEFMTFWSWNRGPCWLCWESFGIGH